MGPKYEILHIYMTISYLGKITVNQKQQKQFYDLGVTTAYEHVLKGGDLGSLRTTDIKGLSALAAST